MPARPHWANAIRDQYGLDANYGRIGSASNRRPPRRSTTAMGVIGGRAAVRETLQLQNITLEDKARRVPSIPVTEIPGVEVKSQPLEEMLGGQPGGSLALADWIRTTTSSSTSRSPSTAFPSARQLLRLPLRRRHHRHGPIRLPPTQGPLP